MKRTLLVMVFAFSMMSAVCFASPGNVPENGSIVGISDSEITGSPVIENGSILGIKDEDVEYTRGCCSHHKGVAYCDSSTGRIVCNDGTYSPSCGC